MSEEQGYIMERDHSGPEKGHDEGYFGDRENYREGDPEIFGNDRNEAGDADADGGDGYNSGDITLNVGQGGDAYALGGDVTTYEEYYVHKEYREYDAHGEQDKYDAHEGCGEHDHYDEPATKEYSGDADVTF